MDTRWSIVIDKNARDLFCIAREPRHIACAAMAVETDGGVLTGSLNGSVSLWCITALTPNILKSYATKLRNKNIRGGFSRQFLHAVFCQCCLKGRYTRYNPTFQQWHLHNQTHFSTHSKPVCVQLPTSAVNVALPVFVAAVPAVQQSIDISYQSGLQQQTRCTLLQRANGTDERTDRQTDGRTPYRYIDPAPHTMREVPTRNVAYISMNTGQLKNVKYE